MAHEVTLTAIYEIVDDGWIQARIQELPEVITAAPTREEAEELLQDALLEYLTSLSEPLEAGQAAGDLQRLQLTVRA
jgi:predicted RNase H-like HicB family nuclease